MLIVRVCGGGKEIPMEMPGIEPGASYMQSMRSTTELHPPKRTPPTSRPMKTDIGLVRDGAPDLQMLYKRLLVAEELGGKVSKDLHIILEQLRNMTQAANVSHLLSNVSCSNTSSSMVKQPSDDLSRQPLHQANIHLYMPHLREHPNSLVPHVALGKGRSGGMEHTH
ncbi:hypothetical protein ATANTOWER_020230 [Ataeniobius toweri]|uniref:Uncharacterized protein n=1 Tax=Ataeniobius toweri TaxID=208326 RepID=A0ABU7C942_9TELE|nr:hypothetical protein [Ataeniobius toweri]